MLSSPLTERRLLDREALAMLRRALTDIQRTSGRTQAMISDTSDLIRLVDKLSGARYPSADKRDKVD
jgi:hypothetical protein